MGREYLVPMGSLEYVKVVDSHQPEVLVVGATYALPILPGLSVGTVPGLVSGPGAAPLGSDWPHGINTWPQIVTMQDFKCVLCAQLVVLSVR